MVKVIGLVGSPRRGGNTELLVTEALKAAVEEGVETKLITLAGRDIKPCDGCRDEEGIKTVRNFGKKVAWLTKSLSTGKF